MKTIEWRYVYSMYGGIEEDWKTVPLIGPGVKTYSMEEVARHLLVFDKPLGGPYKMSIIERPEGMGILIQSPKSEAIWGLYVAVIKE
jgi:hypothetical protein